MKTRILSLMIAAATLGFAPLAMAHDGKDHSHDTHAEAPAVQHGTLEISNAYLRATPPRAPVAGGYLTLTNTGSEPDRLISLTAPVSDEASIHEMAETDGVMTMRPLDNGLPIGAGETVVLEPGGLHLMLMGLKAQLVEGGTVDLTLTFEKAGTITLPFEIRAISARGQADGDCEHAGHGTDGAAKGH